MDLVDILDPMRGTDMLAGLSNAQADALVFVTVAAVLVFLAVRLWRWSRC